MNQSFACRVLAYLTIFFILSGSVNTSLGITLLRSKESKPPNSADQSEQDIRVLEVGKPIEREMKGGEVHIYRLTLMAGQFLHAIVDQRGIDVVVTLIGPDSKLIMEVDSPNGIQGSEPVWAIAETSGNYRLQVRSLEKGAELGRYEVKIKEMRDATEQDKNRVAAEKAFIEADLLQAQRTVDTLKESIEKYTKILPFWRALGDRFREAITFSKIGDIYDNLGNKQKALDFYNQALPILRSLGNRSEEAAILTSIGRICAALGDKQKALDFYQQAIAIQQELNDHLGQGITLNHLGSVYNGLGDKQKALDFYNQALLIVRKEGDRFLEANTISNMGSIYNDLGNRDKALDFLNQALTIQSSLNDRSGEAITLGNLGSVYNRLGDRQKALDLYNQALPLLRLVGNRSEEAAMLTNLGSVYYDLGDKRKALDFYNQALPIHREVGDRYREVITLASIAAIYNFLGDKQKALDLYNQALPIFRVVGDRTGEASTLNNIGRLYDDLGDKQKALEFHNQALLFVRVVGDRIGEAAVLTNIGGVYNSLGDKQRALSFYNQALPIHREVNNHFWEAVTLNNIGRVYDDLGDKRKALDFYNQALPIMRAIGNRSIEAAMLNNIGLIYHDLGDNQKALGFYNQALPINREEGDRFREAITFNNIGRLYDDSGDKQKALYFYQQSLPIHRAVNNRFGEATTLANLGRIYRDLGDKKKAFRLLNQALLLRRDVGDRLGEADTLNNIGRLYDDSGDKQKALYFYQQSIDRLENVKAAATIEEVKMGFAPRSSVIYEHTVLLKIRLGLRTQAYNLTEKARARIFLDQLGNVRPNVQRGADTHFIHEEQMLRSELIALEQKLRQERTKPISSGNELIPKLETQLTVKRREYENLLVRLKLNSTEYASLRSVNELTLQSIQVLLNEDITLLSYFVTPKKTLIFIITRGSFRTIEVPVKEAKLNSLINWFRSFASLRDTQSESLKQLYNLLIARIKQYIKTKVVGIIPHGVLHYLPFAALTDGQQYLGDRYTVFYLPSASVLPFIQKKIKPVGTQVLAIAQNQAEGLPALQYADKEAEAVANLYNMRALITGDAPKSEFLKRAKDHSILHIAAHAELNTSNPIFSRIMLSPDKDDTGALEVREVYDLDLSKASLVVLSACDTQLGALSKGDDIVGLNRAFIYAGTPTVIASLWTVGDESTSYLMKSFYTYLKGGMGKAEALRAAQSDTRKKYPHPYYWAGFVLTGDPGKNANK